MHCNGSYLWGVIITDLLAESENRAAEAKLQHARQQCLLCIKPPGLKQANCTLKVKNCM